MIPPAVARAVASVCVTLAAAGVLQVPQPAGPLVSVDVLVTGADGAPVSGLGKKDFIIVTDAVQRPIVSFTVGKQPLSMLLLLDVTSSVTAKLSRDDLEEDVEEALIDGLNAGERLRIGGFARHLVLNSGLSSNRRQLRNELRAAISHRREDLFGPSPIWDSAYRAIESLPATDGRRALILLTDGRATANVHSIEDVAMMATQHGVAVHIVGQDLQYQIRQDANTALIVRSGNALRWLAAVTGGQFISAIDLQEGPATALTAILAGLRQTYTLTFEAPVADGRVHALEVQVLRANGQIRARNMYVAPLQPAIYP